MKLNIGMVSTRFAGLDGVSLEAAKWAEILEEMGHCCYWLAGELDRPASRSMLVPEAHFQSDVNHWITTMIFDRRRRSPQALAVVHDLRAILKFHLDTECLGFQASARSRSGRAAEIHQGHGYPPGRHCYFTTNPGCSAKRN